MTVMGEDCIFLPLKSYLATIPSIRDISTGFSGDGYFGKPNSYHLPSCDAGQRMA